MVPIPIIVTKNHFYHLHYVSCVHVNDSKLGDVYDVQFMKNGKIRKMLGVHPKNSQYIYCSPYKKMREQAALNHIQKKLDKFLD